MTKPAKLFSILQPYGLAFLACALFAGIACPAAHAEEVSFAVSYSPGTQFHRLVQQRVKAIYKRAGIPVTFVQLPHKRSLHSANTGTVDAEAGRVPSVEARYPNLRRVNVKIMDLAGVAYVLKGSPIKTYTPTLLKEKKIGIVLGVQWATKRTTDIPVTAVSDYDHLFRILRTNRVDLVLATQASAEAVLKTMGDQRSLYRRLEPAIFSAPIYHYVNVKNSRLIPKLTKAAQDLIDENYWAE